METPNRKKHKELIALLFGEDIAEKYEWVHEYKDKPSKYLGVKHRILRHDMQTGIWDNLLLACATQDPMVMIVGFLHDLQDLISTESKRLYGGKRKCRRRR